MIGDVSPPPQAAMTSVLTPVDWLTATRESAGFPTDADLARAAGLMVPGGQNPLRLIRQGHRPTWRTVQRLAPVLGVQVEDVVRHLWRQAVGDPCVCGCGGVK